VTMDGDNGLVPADAAGDATAIPAVSASLRSAREALGLSVQDIANRTRITLRHVEAIEAGNYAALPGRPYALGFARSYARAVGLDDRAIADQVRQELDGKAQQQAPRVIHQFEVGDPSKTPSRLLSWLATLLAIGVIGLGLTFWRSYYWPSAELPALVGPEDARPAAPIAARPAQTASPTTGPVVFTALEDAIWVKFSDGNGQQLLQKQLAKGESWTVPPQAVNPLIWTGRPDALGITIGGKPVRRIAEREGVVKNVGISAAALLARPDVPTDPATGGASGSAAPPTPSPAPVSSVTAR